MRSRTPLALMEQTVMVLVFALAAVLCLRVFVWSDLTSQRGAARDKAAVAAQNAAERIRHTRLEESETVNGNGDRIGDRTEYESGTGKKAGDGIGSGAGIGTGNGELTVFYDRNWNEVGRSDMGNADPGAPGGAAYILTVSETETGIERLAAAHVAVTEKKSGEVLFELDTAWQKEAVR